MNKSEKDCKTLIKFVDDKLHSNVTEGEYKQIVRAGKQAIRKRITNFWQRAFTPNQAFDLNHYAALFPDVIPSELFTHLYEDVINEPDVARKPEKWKTDTLKELIELAEGITR